MVAQFFQTRQELRVVQLIDVCHPPRPKTQCTRLAMQWERPLLVVATKVDKIGRPHRSSHLKQIIEGLNLDAESPVILFSAHTEGKRRSGRMSGVMGL